MSETPAFGVDAYRALGSLAITVLVMALLLFIPAGTVDWPRAWWFLALFVLGVVVAMGYVWRADPELFSIRRKIQPGSKGWDIAFVVVTIISLSAVLPVAAVDFRFGWSQLPDGAVWVGYLLFAVGFWLTAWAQGVNRHFELTVRIQTDRNHQVVDTGPYAAIRHPGYIGGSALALGTALALGSVVALIPASICTVALALRTLAEEQTLRDELPGYADYMHRVRRRWIPGLW